MNFNKEKMKADWVISYFPLLKWIWPRTKATAYPQAIDDMLGEDVGLVEGLPRDDILIVIAIVSSS